MTPRYLSLTLFIVVWSHPVNKLSAKLEELGTSEMIQSVGRLRERIAYFSGFANNTFTLYKILVGSEQIFGGWRRHTELIIGFAELFSFLVSLHIGITDLDVISHKLFTVSQEGDNSRFLWLAIKWVRFAEFQVLWIHRSPSAFVDELFPVVYTELCYVDFHCLGLKK